MGHRRRNCQGRTGHATADLQCRYGVPRAILRPDEARVSLAKSTRAGRYGSGNKSLPDRARQAEYPCSAASGGRPADRNLPVPDHVGLGGNRWRHRSPLPDQQPSWAQSSSTNDADAAQCRGNERPCDLRDPMDRREVCGATNRSHQRSQRVRVDRTGRDHGVAFGPDRDPRTPAPPRWLIPARPAFAPRLADWTTAVSSTGPVRIGTRPAYTRPQCGWVRRLDGSLPIRHFGRAKMPSTFPARRSATDAAHERTASPAMPAFQRGRVTRWRTARAS